MCYLSVRREKVVTAEQFRRLALSYPEAYESVHMGHPDFRVRGGKIFATLAYPDGKWGMVKLTPEQQEELRGAGPGVFEPGLEHVIALGPAWPHRYFGVE